MKPALISCKVHSLHTHKHFFVVHCFDVFFLLFSMHWKIFRNQICYIHHVLLLSCSAQYFFMVSNLFVCFHFLLQNKTVNYAWRKRYCRHERWFHCAYHWPIISTTEFSIRFHVPRVLSENSPHYTIQAIAQRGATKTAFPPTLMACLFCAPTPTDNIWQYAKSERSPGKEAITRQTCDVRIDTQNKFFDDCQLPLWMNKKVWRKISLQ